MSVSKKSVTTAKGAKDYLSKNEIPQLFECLMTGLMYNRPVDYIDYLQECLEKIKSQGVNSVKWDLFLEAKKAPLPPIQSSVKDDYRPEPLPIIGDYKLEISADSKIILLVSGPGMNKKKIGEEISSHFSDIHRVKLGDLLRERAKVEAQNDESKWKQVTELINNGELAPSDFVAETLIDELNKNSDKKHFLIEGYPRNLTQKENLERHISIARVNLLLLIDSEEDRCLRQLSDRSNLEGWEDCNEQAIKKRMLCYKQETLPACKSLDDLGKLKLINGDEELSSFMPLVFEEIDREVFKKSEPCRAKSPSVKGDNNEQTITTAEENKEEEEEMTRPMSQRGVTEIVELTSVAPEADRLTELPEQLKLVLLIGGPGCGKTEVAQLVCQQNPSVLHLNLNEVLRNKVINASEIDVTLADKISENEANVTENWKWNPSAVKELLLSSITENTTSVVLEGYPRSKDELEDMNTNIGKIDTVVLLDSEEDEMRQRLQKRYTTNQESGTVLEEDNENNVDERIVFFKNNGLSICRYYDERSRLNIVYSDRDIALVTEEVASLISTDTKITNNSAATELENNDTIVEENTETNKLLKDENAAEEEVTEPSRGGENEEETVEAAEPKDPSTKEYDEEKVKAAIKIQSNMRGHMARKKLATAEKQESVIEPLEAQETNAIEYGDDMENMEEDDIEPTLTVPLGSKGVRSESQLKMNHATLILMIGGPGSGKKSLGDHLVTKHAISFIHVDQVFKKLLEENEEAEEKNTSGLIEAITHYLYDNEEADISLLMPVIRQEVSKTMESSSKIILAGFPRNLSQLKIFENDVADPSLILHLDVDSDTLKSRLEQEGDEESNEQVKKRIETFTNQFPELLDSIKESEKYKLIDASKSVENILEEVSPIIAKTLEDSAETEEKKEEPEEEQQEEDTKTDE